jgi:FdhD protein
MNNEIQAVEAPPANLRVGIEVVSGSDTVHTNDVVTIEEPLEIRLSYLEPKGRVEQSISITMRTPGNDAELAIGFLAGEAIIDCAADIEFIEHCGPPSPDKGIKNVIRVKLGDEVSIDASGLIRHFYTTSSCGVCGKASLDAVRVHIDQRPPSHFVIPATVLTSLPSALRAKQAEFARTGGLHASASFDESGTILRVREDVGRHNAFDKLAGSYLREKGLVDKGVLLSGRASFELLQKAAVAGVAIVTSIGPPSSLAIELAEEAGITLVGFLKEDRFNIYTFSHRISADRISQ